MKEGGLITRWTHRRDRDIGIAPVASDMAEMLASTAHHAATILFHDEGGNPSGHWDQVLGADQSFALALLSTIDLSCRGEALTRAVAEARSATLNDAGTRISALVEAMLRLARDLDAWLAPSQSGGTMERDWAYGLAQNVLDRVLAPQLQRLFDQVADAEEDRVFVRRHGWAEDARPWQATIREGEIRGISRAVERAWAQRLIRDLADAAEMFLEDMADASDRASKALEQRLQSGAHQGHAALVIAFLEVFRHAREEMNALPERVLGYWLDHLGAEPAPGRGDQLLLAVVPRPGARPTVPKGLIVPAGKDAMFAAETGLTVTGATIRELRVWAPDGLSVSRAAPGKDGLFAELACEPTLPVTLLASPALALPGGTRRLCVRLSGTETPTISEDVAVELSTAAGWVEVRPSWTAERDALVLCVLLPDTFPALTPAPGADTPALRLTARAANATTVTGASLQISVRDAPGLAVSTPAGPASDTAAAPFGTPPFAGGWLRIDHPALAGPPLERLVIRFDWAGLPPGDSGFAGLYRGYRVDDQGMLMDQVPFDNAAFTVTLDAPVLGWDARRQLPLFAPAVLGSAPPVAAVPPPDILADSFEDAPPLMPADGPLAPGSWLAASGGSGTAQGDHVLVTLAAPAQAFGHALHAANVQWATEAMARAEMPVRRPGLIRRIVRTLLRLPKAIAARMSARQSVKPDPAPDTAPVLLPNPPFQPLLSGIALDYAVAAQVLPISHLPPFEPATADSAGRLFPQPLAAPTLELVVDGAEAGAVLSLLWQLGLGGSTPDWWYRSYGSWKKLAMLEDGTAGLRVSGILRMVVPADAAAGALRLQARFAGALPHVLAVLPDAFAAQRRVLENDGLQPVAPGTVAKLPGVTGVAALMQPLASTGGSPPEAEASVRARVVERVRHGGRAQTCWDVERLVLAAFPDVARIRVVPAQKGMTVLVEADAALRSGIAAWLRERASPFARIDVVAPEAVPVDVTAELVGDGDLAAIEAAVRVLIEDELSLTDGASVEEVRAAVLRLLLGEAQVEAIERLSVSLGTSDAPWRVPVAGVISIAAIEGANRW